MTNLETQMLNLNNAYAGLLRAVEGDDQRTIDEAAHALDAVAVGLGMRKNQMGPDFARKALAKAGLY